MSPGRGRVRSWRPVLRIARRDVLRHRGVSVLVVLLVALPITGLSAVAVVVRSSALTAAERAERQLGTADASLTWLARAPVGQAPPPVSVTTDVQPAQSIADDPVGLLPAGSRTTRVATAPAVLSSSSGADPVVAVALDPADDLTTGLLVVVTGRLATGPDEVAVSLALAQEQRLRVGDRVDLRAVAAADPGAGPPLVTARVVGVAVPPAATQELAVQVAPDTLAGAAVAGQRWLARLAPGTAPGSLAPGLGAQGIAVLTRGDAEQPVPWTGDRSSADVAGLASALALLEVVLLSAAAFTVTAHRSQRQLALLSVVGGDARHLRRTVLAGGGLLGLVGGLLGAAAGPLAARALRPLAEDRAGAVLGAWQVPWSWLAGIVTLAVASGTVAALAPARAAARRSPAQALTTDVTGGPRLVLTWLAAPVLVVCGGVLLERGGRDVVRPDQLLTGAGTVLVVLGVCCLLPVLVVAGGRLARWSGPAVRMALRDNARHLARTSAAAAAVLLVVAGCAALATYLVSADAHHRSGHQPALAEDQLSIALNRPPVDPAEADRTTAALREALPTASIAWLAPVGGCADRAPCAGATLAVAPPCTRPGACATLRPGTGQLVGDDAGTVSTVFGDAAPQARTALAAGRVVVRDPALAPEGVVTLVTTSAADPRSAGPTRSSRVTLPATVVRTPDAALLPAGVVPRQALVAGGLGVQPPTGILVATPGAPSDGDVARAQQVVDQHGGGELRVERGYRSSVTAPLLLLALTAAATTLGTLVIVIALTVGENRQQSAVLAALGAGPADRRRLGRGDRRARRHRRAADRDGRRGRGRRRPRGPADRRPLAAARRPGRRGAPPGGASCTDRAGWSSG